MAKIDQDNKWNTVFGNLTDKEWINMKNIALDIWDHKLTGITKDPEIQLELDTCPMHPGFFFEFSSVSGFNNNNGWSYSEYVSGWWERRGYKYGIPRPNI